MTRASGDGVRVVLLVDDHSDTREMYSEYLRAMGLDTRQATSCREAIAVATAGTIDAVVLDRGLPDGDGGEVCRALRSHPQTRRLPIVVISGKPNDGTVAADAYLMKPVAPELLLSEVSQLLALRPR